MHTWRYASLEKYSGIVFNCYLAASGSHISVGVFNMPPQCTPPPGGLETNLVANCNRHNSPNSLNVTDPHAFKMYKFNRFENVESPLYSIIKLHARITIGYRDIPWVYILASRWKLLYLSISTPKWIIFRLQCLVQTQQRWLWNLILRGSYKSHRGWNFKCW